MITQVLLEKNDFEDSKNTLVDSYQRSNCFSKLFFHWAYEKLKIANKVQLKNETLGIIEGDNKPEIQYEWIKQVWNDKKYKNRKRCRMFCTILKTNSTMLFALQIFSILISILEVLNVFAFRHFIDLFQKDEKPEFQTLVIWASIYIGIKIGENLLNTQSSFYQQILGSRTIIQLNSLIFDKILVESPSSTKYKVTQGEIINYIQTDSYKINDLISWSPFVIVIPFKLTAFLYMLFYYFGYIFSIGLGTMIFIMVINMLIQMKVAPLETEKMNRIDERMKLTTEVLNHLKLLKLYSWENEFLKKIIDLRKKELDIYWKSNLLYCYVIYFFWACPTFVAISSFTSYQFLIGDLNLVNIMTLISVFNNLSSAITFFPFFIHTAIECSVALSRIEKYLDQDEINHEKTHILSDKTYDIIIENGNFSWGIEKKKDEKENKDSAISDQKSTEKSNPINNQDESLISLKENATNQSLINNNSTVESNGFKKILKNINLKVRKGELVGIIGEIGSGKSSLLQAILDNLLVIEETEEKQTKIVLNGSVSYVNQSAWIINDTIKNNIILFNNNNLNNYQKILDLCELRTDLESLPGLDNTEIGEKGINISGGQKARISIARALISNSEIYMFDDPISALDAHVGKKIMKNVIVDYLKGKTRILVTHALQYLSFCDRIIVMKGGEIFWEGDYTSIINEEFFKEFSLKSKHERKKSEESDSEGNEKNSENLEMDKTNNIKAVTRITKDEEQLEGMVKFEIKNKYVKMNGGYKNFVLIFTSILIFNLVMLIWQTAKCSSDILLAFWTKFQDLSANYEYFWIYLCLGGISTFFIYFRVLILSIGSYKCSDEIHKTMISKIINAPINIYHDTTPKGQILNNLSKDLGTIDDSLMYNYGGFLASFMCLMGGIVVCSIFMPFSLFMLPILAFIFYKVIKVYINGARDLFRLEGIAKSPILNTLSETISGITTIRAHKHEKLFFKNFLMRAENLMKVKLFSRGTNNWLSVVLNNVCVIYSLCLLVFAIVFKDSLEAQSISLILAYSMYVQDNVFWLFLELVNFELGMVSVERCLKYENIPQEASSNCLLDNELKDWPQTGEIKFVNYSVKYRQDTPLILKNLNITIQPKEKIGIVGRTGSGKSTLCLCVFRLLEPYSGNILIDNIDISSIGLNLLRSKLTIIPQDGMLMEGTLRFNIDPLSQYSEEEILNVTNSIGLNLLLENNKIGLNSMISENGGNLSVGERQLISIARAILRKSKIIIMDEATANIDVKTEEMIQKAIHDYLDNSTIITIAHRIKTVLNYDKIITMKNGEIIEYDTPKNLINNKDSLFYELYSHSSIL